MISSPSSFSEFPNLLSTFVPGVPDEFPVVTLLKVSFQHFYVDMDRKYDGTAARLKQREWGEEMSMLSWQPDPPFSTQSWL